MECELTHDRWPGKDIALHPIHLLHARGFEMDEDHSLVVEDEWADIFSVRSLSPDSASEPGSHAHRSPIFPDLQIHRLFRQRIEEE
jgi:hypothetical protein